MARRRAKAGQSYIVRRMTVSVLVPNPCALRAQFRAVAELEPSDPEMGVSMSGENFAGFSLPHAGI